MPELAFPTVSLPRKDETIAEAILRTTADMRRNGTFETDALCWPPAALERLAMFAIGAKNALRRKSPAGEG